jgi:hypothetical protein
MKMTYQCNIRRQQFLYLIVVLAFCFIGFGCATPSTTGYIKATGTTNPPPKYEFSRYEKFIAEPIVIAEQFREQNANIGAAATIQEHLNNKLNPLLQSWNKDTKTSELKTLVIKPRIEAIKFIGAGARFWVGGLAGNSGVLMRVNIVDQKTGEIIGNPEFYQHANATAGGWSVGGTDYAMLNRISDLIVQYMSDNYKNAVGGRTGAGN